MKHQSRGKHMSLYTHLQEILKNEFGELPTKGVLAGQAVAEAYFIAAGVDVKSRMKDLDWFVEREDEFVETPRFMSATSITPVVELFCPSHDVDLRVGQFVKYGLYTIVTSDVINGGRINRIVVQDPARCKKITPMVILDGFDINCAACALDLDNKTVVLHPKFIEFCETKKLDLISIHTPLSSLIRIIEKNSYIDGTSVDVPELTRIVSSCIWARYSDSYMSFEESTIAAPNDYKRGTGITTERFDKLSDDVKFVLLENFVKHTIVLSDGGEIFTFIPKQEPKRINTLISAKHIDVSVISYSLDFMRSIASLSDVDFFNTVIYPLNSLSRIVNLPCSFERIETCLTGLVLKVVFVDGVMKIKDALADLRIEDTISLLGYGSELSKSKKEFFADVIESLYMIYFYGTQTTGFKSNECSLAAINALLTDVTTWSDDTDFEYYGKLSLRVKFDLINKITSSLDGHLSVGSLLSGFMNDEISQIEGFSDVDFGFDEKIQKLTDTQYTVWFPKTLKEVMNAPSYDNFKHFNYATSIFMAIDIDYKGEPLHMICEVVWNEFYARYDVIYLFQYDNNERYSELNSVFNGIALHAKAEINQEIKYSWKRIKALKRQVVDQIVTSWKGLVEIINGKNNRIMELNNAMVTVREAANDKSGDIPF